MTALLLVLTLLAHAADPWAEVADPGCPLPGAAPPPPCDTAAEPVSPTSLTGDPLAACGDASCGADAPICVAGPPPACIDAAAWRTRADAGTPPPVVAAATHADPGMFPARLRKHAVTP